MASARRPAPEAGSSPTAGLVRVGKLTGTHGLRGALRFHPDDPDSTALSSLARIYLEIDGEPREYRLLSSARLNRGNLKITLGGIGTPEAAKALNGAIVLIAASDLPPLEPGEFYYFQVLGMEVRLAGGRTLGRIEDVFSTGANDVWVVRRDSSDEVLVPVIEDVVKSIDFEARVATIEAIPGLLE